MVQIWCSHFLWCLIKLKNGANTEKKALQLHFTWVNVVCHLHLWLTLIKGVHLHGCDFYPSPGSFHTPGGASWHLWEPKEKLRNRPDHTCHQVSGEHHPPQHSAVTSIHTPRLCDTSNKCTDPQSKADTLAGTQAVSSFINVTLIERNKG